MKISFVALESFYDGARTLLLPFRNLISAMVPWYHDEVATPSIARWGVLRQVR